VLGIQIPERYGGTGMGMLELSVAVEEIARADSALKVPRLASEAVGPQALPDSRVRPDGLPEALPDPP